MKLRMDRLKIQSGGTDAKGHKVDPEGQILEREIAIQADMTHGGRPIAGSIPTSVVFETTAGQFAEAMRSPCWNCKFFDNKGSQDLIRRWDASDAPKDKRSFVNQMRGNIIGTKDPEFIKRHMTGEGEISVNHALMSLGICRALTEIQGDVVFVDPTSTCPDELCGPGRPNGMWESKDAAAERHGNKIYDGIMKRAAGQL